MKILLDENLPESLLAAQAYDLCFTRDAGFVHNVRQTQQPANVKVLRVAIPQRRAGLFVDVFVKAFVAADWSQYANGNDWA